MPNWSPDVNPRRYCIEILLLSLGDYANLQDCKSWIMKLIENPITAKQMFVICLYTCSVSLTYCFPLKLWLWIRRNDGNNPSWISAWAAIPCWHAAAVSALNSNHRRNAFCCQGYLEPRHLKFLPVFPNSRKHNCNKILMIIYFITSKCLTKIFL